MRKQLVSMLALAVVAAGLSGCLAYRDPDAPAPATQDDLRYLRAEIQRQQQHINALEQQLGQLNGDIAQDRYRQSSTASAYASAAQVAALQDQLAQLQQQLRSSEQNRIKDRDEIMGSVSKTIAAAVKKSAPATSGSTGGRTKATGTHTGIEHVVQPGESLSAIAAAYGVKTSVVLEYNDIANPSLIRVGQKLFIPQ